MAGIDITGTRSGKLEAIRRDGRYGNNQIRWLIRCDCGVETHSSAGAFRAGQVKQCRACSTKSNAKHGLRNARIYRIWGGIRARCERPSHVAYARYGGRGISVCEEWMDFRQFCSWAMANGYTDEVQIDRIDNAGPYSPSNCRWTSAETNMNNRQVSVNWDFFGETLSAPQASRKYSISAKTITSRIRGGMTPDAAVTEPRKIEPRRFLFDGEILSVAEIAAKAGISLGTLNSRLERGWTVERAVSQEKRITRCKR